MCSSRHPQQAFATPTWTNMLRAQWSGVLVFDTKSGKEDKKHVYHFDGTGDCTAGGVKSGFSSWEDHEDEAQLIPWWMFG